MKKILKIGDIPIELTRKAVKHVHLSVYPPDGRVTLVAPKGTRSEVARAYAISKLAWIQMQQDRYANQDRELPRKFVGLESHYLWGRRYLLEVKHQEAKPHVRLDHRKMTLIMRPDSSGGVRAAVMHEWHKSLLHAAVPPLIRKWEAKLGVDVTAYFLQRMKTKWGSCNPRRRHIRLNTELIKKPKDLLEYVVVHEMLHLLEPTHSERFLAMMNKHYPMWREARSELNELPLGDEHWRA